MRVLDVDGREVHSAVKGDRRGLANALQLGQILGQAAAASKLAQQYQ
jgi:hypothetical protein